MALSFFALVYSCVLVATSAVR